MRFVLVLCTALLTSTSAYALTDAQTLPLLQAMGEWQAAYPLAINEAQRHNTLNAWASVYQQPEYAALTQPFSRAQVYAAAWQATQQANTVADYRRFITLAPESVGSLLAIEAHYQLARQHDTLEAYTEFMAEYPEATQSLDAMLRVQELIWRKVKTENTVAGYDRYLDTFPESRFAPEAEQAAQQLVAQPYAKTLAQCAQDAETLRLEQKSRGEMTARREAEQMRKDCIEDLARTVFNTARKSQTPRAGLRFYAYLDAERAFTNTKVTTEHLDRQERREHQAKLEGLLQQQLAQSQQQTNALLAALETQTQRLEAATEKQTQRLEAATEKQTQRLSSVIETNAKRLEEGIQGLRRSMAVGNMCPELGPVILAAAKSACVLALDPAARDAVEDTVTGAVQAAQSFI